MQNVSISRSVRRVIAAFVVGLVVLSAAFAVSTSPDDRRAARARSEAPSGASTATTPASRAAGGPGTAPAASLEDASDGSEETGPAEPIVDPAAFVAEHRDELPEVERFDRRTTQAPVEIFDDVRAIVDAEGTVSVTAGLQTRFTPEALLDASAVAAQRAEIAAARSRLLGAITGVHGEIGSYESLPYVSLELDAAGVAALEDSGLAATLEQDVEDRPTLSSTTAVIQSTLATAMGVDGSGFSIAVIDTGVQNNHPFLNGRVVSEACFSNSSDCPNGRTQQTGAGSAAPCTFQQRCDHGTHVAGIAAGRRFGTETADGVAGRANVVAINATNEGECDGPSNTTVTCAVFSRSDYLAGLNRVFDIRNQFQVAAVNMSLGSGDYASSCDTVNPAIKTAIDQLWAAGIPTFVSSGNNSDTTPTGETGSTDGISFPACISTAFAVGATTDGDVPDSYGNSDDQVSFWAPGSSVRSSVPGGGFGSKSGTSMAAPHVAGAFTALRERFAADDAVAANDNIDPALALLSLSLGSPQVTDPRNNVTRPRIAMTPSLQALGFAYLTGYDTDTGIAAVNRLHTEGGIGAAVESTSFGKGLSIVEPFNVGSKEFLLQYNATTGASQRYEVGADGKRGALIATHSWSKGHTLIRHVAVGAKTFRLFYNGTTGAGSVYEVTGTGANGTKVDERTWSKGWTSIEHYIVGPKTFRLFYRFSDGLYQINEVTTTGTNGVVTGSTGTAANWDAGWSEIQHVTVGTKTFRVFYRSANGNRRVVELKSDGTNGTTTSSGTWTTGWTQVRHVVDRGVAYRFFYRAGDGQLLIHRVAADGANGAQVHSGIWKAGKEVVIPSFVSG